jgi:excinuclease ABC subunit B
MGRRRATQEAHNAAHGIRPVSIHKSVEEVRFVTRVADARTERPAPERAAAATPLDRDQLIVVLEKQMREAAAELDFELAAQLRDQVFELRAAGDPVRTAPAGAATTRSPAARHGGRRRRG